jgi:hypothetical protein
MGIRRKKKKKKVAQSSERLKHATAAVVIALLFIGGAFGMYRVVAWMGRPMGVTDKLTFDAYQTLKAGVPLKELEARFGTPAKVAQSEVDDAFMSRQGEIDGMTKTYDIKTWNRWTNKTAKMFAGAREQGEVAAIGYIDNDPEHKNFASGWEVLPISASIEVGIRPSSPGAPAKAAPPRLVTFEGLLHTGMSADEVTAAVGAPETIQRGSTTPAGGKKTESEVWIYQVDLSMNGANLPLMGTGSVGAGAAGPLAAASFLVPRHYGWQVTFLNKQVVAVQPLRR